MNIGSVTNRLIDFELILMRSNDEAHVYRQSHVFIDRSSAVLSTKKNECHKGVHC
jgi:hypothetical protein